MFIQFEAAICGTAWRPNDIHLPAQGSEQTSLELAQLFAVGWDTLANRMPKLFPQTSAAGGRVALNPDSRPERERHIFPAISSWTITHLTGRVSCVDRCVGVIFGLACAAAAYFDGIDSEGNGPRSTRRAAIRVILFLCPSRQATRNYYPRLFSQLGCDLDPLGSIPDVT